MEVQNTACILNTATFAGGQNSLLQVLLTWQLRNKGENTLKDTF